MCNRMFVPKPVKNNESTLIIAFTQMHENKVFISVYLSSFNYYYFLQTSSELNKGLNI